MPTRTRSPSVFAHSCSLVYMRSDGTFAMGPIVATARPSDRFVAGRVVGGQPAVRGAAGAGPDTRRRTGWSSLDVGWAEWGPHHAGGFELPADFDAKLRAEGRIRDGHVAQRDVGVRGRSV